MMPALAASGIFSDLLERLAAALVLAALTAITLVLGGWVFGLFVAGLTAFAASEWAGLVREERGMSDAARLAMIGSGAAVPMIAGFMPWLGLVATIGAIGVVFALNQRRLGPIAIAGLAVLLLAAVALLALRDLGAGLVLWVILAVIGVDAGGYFAGRSIGGPKLWPAISPKKTWSGFVGGAVLAIAISAGAAILMDGDQLRFCLFGFLIAVVALAGDIAESAVKRHFGVKDSGTILPGHGGLLDRFDGLSFAVIVVAFLIWAADLMSLLGVG